MKKILFPFIILSILLAACAPQSAQTAIAQATTTTEAPTPTAPAPTVAPAVTEAPTIVPTATEAIDPQTGWKMQMVDGEKQLFSPDVNAWVVPNGSAYLIRHDELSIMPDAFEMQVFRLAQNGFVEPVISQAPELSSTSVNFTTIFELKVEKRILGHMLPNLTPDAVATLLSGKPITIANGESFTVTKDSKYRVYIMPYDQMPDGYQEWKSAGYKWIAKGDGTNAVAIIALRDLPSSKQIFMHRIMYPLAAMMTPNQSAGLYTPTIQAYAAGDGDYAGPASIKSFDVSGLP